MKALMLMLALHGDYSIPAYNPNAYYLTHTQAQGVDGCTYVYIKELNSSYVMWHCRMMRLGNNGNKQL